MQSCPYIYIYPQISLRELGEFLKDLQISEKALASHEYIRRIKDSFVECVKLVHGQALTRAVVDPAAEGAQTLFIRYVHDEASLKLRSWIRRTDADFPG